METFLHEELPVQHLVLWEPTHDKCRPGRPSTTFVTPSRQMSGQPTLLSLPPACQIAITGLQGMQLGWGRPSLLVVSLIWLTKIVKFPWHQQRKDFTLNTVTNSFTYMYMYVIYSSYLRQWPCGRLLCLVGFWWIPVAGCRPHPCWHLQTVLWVDWERD